MISMIPSLAVPIKFSDILHILRNPYNIPTDKIRDARLAACEAIDGLERSLKFIASQDDKTGNWAVQSAKVALAESDR